MPPTPLHDLINLGPKMLEWLDQIGIHSKEDIEAEGVVEVYRRLKAAYPDRASLNALWSLQGALMDIPWMRLPDAVKQTLRDELETAERSNLPPAP